MTDGQRKEHSQCGSFHLMCWDPELRSEVETSSLCFASWSAEMWTSSLVILPQQPLAMKHCHAFPILMDHILSNHETKSIILPTHVAHQACGPWEDEVTNTVLEKGTAFLTSAGCSAVLLSFCCIAWLSMTHGTESLGVYCLNHVWSHSLQFNQVLMLSQYC